MLVETTAIDPFTLAFASKELENKWQHRGCNRQAAISTRFFVAAALYQGLFIYADAVESRTQSDFIRLLRFLLMAMPLCAAALIGTRRVLPSQMLLFWLNICYGVPTVIIHYSLKPLSSVWDCLFLVYGLCFFALPKISPLSFGYACMGTLVFIMLHLWLSAITLAFHPWIISSLLLSVIATLFCSISYSSEKSARERFILRERLQREHICIQLLDSSATDGPGGVGMPLPFDVTSLIRGLQSSANFPVALASLPSTGGSSTTPSLQNDQKMLLLKGMAAWILCTMIAYASDYIRLPVPVSGHGLPLTNWPRDTGAGGIDSSAAFALLMHTVGFSMFLMMVTGQVRWLLLNGLVGLSVLWIFTRTFPDEQVAFYTHTFGYVVLGCVVVVVLCVFGGVVLVWSHLVEYVCNILRRYPQVHDDVKASRLLEQVLIRHLIQTQSANIPNILARTPSNPHLTLLPVHRYDTLTPEPSSPKSPHTIDFDSRPKVQASNRQNPSSREPLRIKTSSNSSPDPLISVLETKRPSCCYFCLKQPSAHYIPACTAWASKGSGAGPTQGTSLPMCTPYTTLLQTRDGLQEKLRQLQAQLNLVEGARSEQQECIKELRQLLASSKAAVLKKGHETQQAANALALMRTQHDEHVKELLGTINSQVGQLKELQRQLSELRQSQEQIGAQIHAQTQTQQIETCDSEVQTEVEEAACPGQTPQTPEVVCTATHSSTQTETEAHVSDFKFDTDTYWSQPLEAVLALAQRHDLASTSNTEL